MSIAEIPKFLAPEAPPQPTAEKSKRLSIAERIMLAKQLGDELGAFTGKIFGDKPEAEKRMGEELVQTETGMYRFGRSNDGVSETNITFIPNNPNDVSVHLKSAQAKWETAPSHELRVGKGDTEPQVLEFNPNMTPSLVPGAEDAAFKACGEFLGKAQAEIGQTSVPAVA